MQYAGLSEQGFVMSDLGVIVWFDSKINVTVIFMMWINVV